MRSPGFWAMQGGVVSIALLATGSLASANTMTFDLPHSPSYGTICCNTTPYSEDGIIASPTQASGTSLPNDTHYDIQDLGLYGGTPGTNSVGIIHRGNGGEQITFTFTGGNFDLASLDITGWDQDGDPTTLSGIFTSSKGGTRTVTNPTLGSLNFTGDANWANISFFSFTVPVGVGVCVTGSVSCAGVGFDNVVMNAPVATPLPAALPLLVSALGALGLLTRRRKMRVEAI
jgi:hypothetical protein